MRTFSEHAKIQTSLILLCLLAMNPLSVSAHPGHMTGGDVISGFMHVFTGIDHLILGVCLGFWVASTGSLRCARQSFISYATGMLAGILILQYLGSFEQAFVQVAILGVAGMCGMVYSMNSARTMSLCCISASLLGLFQGAAHGQSGAHSLGLVAGGLGIAAGAFIILRVLPQNSTLLPKFRYTGWLGFALVLGQIT
jgi:urease accessory protein